jgi:hypothetical protein
MLEYGLPYTKLNLVELIHNQGRKNVKTVTQSTRKGILRVQSVSFGPKIAEN